MFPGDVPTLWSAGIDYGATQGVFPVGVKLLIRGTRRYRCSFWCVARVFIRYTAGITMRFMLYTYQITGSVHIMIAFEVTVTFFRKVPTGSCSKFLCLDGYDSGLRTLSLFNVVYVIDGFFPAFGHLSIHTSMNKANVI